MAEETTPFGNISTEEVYGIIGRLYTQLWAATNQASELSQGLALANQRINSLETSINQKNLQGLFEGETASKENQSEPQAVVKKKLPTGSVAKTDESSS